MAIDMDQQRGRSDEEESVWLTQPLPRDRSRGSVEGDLVLCGVTERLIRIGSEHERAGPGPAKAARHRGINPKKGRTGITLDPSEGDHRLGEGHADLGGLAEAGNSA